MNQHPASNPADSNPYAPPEQVGSQTLPPRRPTRRWLFGASILQILVIAGAVAFEAVNHETIVVSGPVHFAVGLAVALLAFRWQQHFELFLGVVAMAFPVLVALRIIYNEWSPGESDGPNTLLILAYAALAVPGWVAATVHQGRAGERPPQTP